MAAWARDGPTRRLELTASEAIDLEDFAQPSRWCGTVRCHRGAVATLSGAPSRAFCVFGSRDCDWHSVRVATAFSFNS